MIANDESWLPNKVRKKTAQEKCIYTNLIFGLLQGPSLCVFFGRFWVHLSLLLLFTSCNKLLNPFLIDYFATVPVKACACACAWARGISKNTGNGWWGLAWERHPGTPTTGISILNPPEPFSDNLKRFSFQTDDFFSKLDPPTTSGSLMTLFGLETQCCLPIATLQELFLLLGLSFSSLGNCRPRPTISKLHFQPIIACSDATLLQPMSKGCENIAHITFHPTTQAGSTQRRWEKDCLPWAPHAPPIRTHIYR